jgi:hypothetical protein
MDSGIALSFRAFSDEHRLFSLGHVPNHNAIILPSSEFWVGGAVHVGNGGHSEMFWRRDTC